MRRSFAGLAALLLILAARPAHAEGDVDRGRELVLEHCARCHVVADHNPYGGVGNSPSFHRLVTWSNGIWRISTFFERPPHPVFVRMEGVPEMDNVPPTAAPFSLTLQDLEDIVAFAEDLRAQHDEPN